MIGRADLVARVREWGLREDVVEKDYVLGWLLWGIAEHPILGNAWVFKGGTCLKKCYIETYRFSEDLDFTVMPDGPITPEQTLPLLEQVLNRVGQESGIDFSLREPRLRLRPSGRAAEARVYYQGPRKAPEGAGGGERQARSERRRGGGSPTGSPSDGPSVSRHLPDWRTGPLLLL